jgi:hypothetical protein
MQTPIPLFDPSYLTLPLITSAAKLHSNPTITLIAVVERRTLRFTSTFKAPKHSCLVMNLYITVSKATMD